MQISTDSWHYQLVSNQYVDVPDNLCPYMRCLFKCMVRVALKYATITTGFIILGCITLAPLMWLVNWFAPFLPASWLVLDESGTALFMIASVVGAFLYTASALFIGLVLAAAKISDYRYRRITELREKKRPERKPGLLVTWLKGLREKSCTSIEFVEPTETF